MSTKNPIVALKNETKNQNPESFPKQNETNRKSAAVKKNTANSELSDDLIIDKDSISNEHVQNNQQPEAQNEVDSESALSDITLTIKEAKCYNRFLLKVGFEFSLYYLVLIAMLLFVLLDVRNTRRMYRLMYLNIVMWIFLAVCLIIRLTISIIGQQMRVILKFFYFLDVVLMAFFIVGLFYFLQEQVDNTYYTYSPFVVVYVVNLFTASLLFSMTTFYKSRKYRYNFFIGFGLMTVGTTLVSIGFYYFWKSVVTVTIAQYIGIIFIMALHNIYFSVNAYFMVRYRAEQVYQHDSVYAFYRFWTDMFYFFWRDMFVGSYKKKNVKDQDIEKPLENVRPSKDQTKYVKRERNVNELTSSIASKGNQGESKSQRESVVIA